MPTQKLSINDLEVNVSIRGDGSPLLLINGLGGLIRAFDPLRKELSDYTTITLDVPGVGKSQMPLWPMRLPRHADTIAQMLTQLGFDQVDVFGVSWGGALAQEFALRYPTMVRRLILAATSAGPAMLVKPADVLDFLSIGKSLKSYKTKGPRRSVKALMSFGVANGMLSVNPRTYYLQLAALVGWTSLHRLSRLRQRTLILAGDCDPLVRLYNAHILRRAIRGAELHVLHGEGHFFVVTRATQTADAIRDFLQQTHYEKKRVIANPTFRATT
ncbi:alpha/beta fold hydrolase [Pseudomonas sp. NMS19W]|uniref:alpha/beta fold hydrolase n=1 Tax=Pseudomonas sp. NMS19W TaxID=3079768 RepID=UPI003F655888